MKFLLDCPSTETIGKKMKIKGQTKTIIFLSACVLLTSCLAEKQNKKVELIKSSIINGEVVASDNKLAKSVVGLFSKYRGGWYNSCTGIVLSERVILTAAHCIEWNDVSTMKVNFSLESLSYSAQVDAGKFFSEEEIEAKYITRKVKAYRVHPYYSEADNDLAVILLEKEIPSDATPVKLLPDSYLNLAENKTTLDEKKLPVTLLGFGIVSENPNVSTEVMRMTTVPARFEKQFVITDQTHGSGGCSGDSGGPAFAEVDGATYMVGVTHGPYGESTNCHEEGQWTNPALSKAFIQKATEEMLAE